MKRTLLFTIAAIALSSCTPSHESRSYDETDTEYSETAETSDYTPSHSQSDAVSAAQDFVRENFAADAEFESSGTVKEKTAVDGRYKILQQFTTDSHESGYTKFVYRIYVQKIDGQWEFGDLEVDAVADDSYSYHYTGDLKSKDTSSASTAKVSGIDYEIGRQVSGNYIEIFSNGYLKRKEVKKLIEQYQGQYHSVKFYNRNSPSETYVETSGEAIIDYHFNPGQIGDLSDW
jgi:hypothetical protein